MRQEKPVAQVTQRTLEALLLVAAERDGLTPKELALHLGVSLSTAYHLIHALEAAGFAVRRQRGIVSVGPMLYRLLDLVQAQRPMALDALVRLADQLSEATEARTYLAVWSAGDVEVVYIRGRRGQRELPGMRQGFRGAAHALALGKVLVADLPLEAWPAYLRQQRLPALTPFTVTDPARFVRELERVAALGVAYDTEEYALGSCCIGVPVSLPSQGEAPMTAALAIAVPPRRFLRERELLTGLLRGVVQHVG